jgi:hypothetical protein
MHRLIHSLVWFPLYIDWTFRYYIESLVLTEYDFGLLDIAWTLKSLEIINILKSFTGVLIIIFFFNRFSSTTFNEEMIKCDLVCF